MAQVPEDDPMDVDVDDQSTHDDDTPQGHSRRTVIQSTSSQPGPASQSLLDNPDVIAVDETDEEDVGSSASERSIELVRDSDSDDVIEVDGGEEEDSEDNDILHARDIGHNYTFQISCLGDIDCMILGNLSKDYVHSCVGMNYEWGQDQGRLGEGQDQGGLREGQDEGGLRVGAGSGRATSGGRIREGFKCGEDQGGLRVGAGSAAFSKQAGYRRKSPPTQIFAPATFISSARVSVCFYERPAAGQSGRNFTGGGSCSGLELYPRSCIARARRNLLLAACDRRSDWFTSHDLRSDWISDVASSRQRGKIFPRRQALAGPPDPPNGRGATPLPYPPPASRCAARFEPLRGSPATFSYQPHTLNFFEKADQGGLRVGAGSGRATSEGRIREGYQWGQDQGGLPVGAGSGRATSGGRIREGYQWGQDQGGLPVGAGSGRASSVGRIREGYQCGQDQGGLPVGAGSGRATSGGRIREGFECGEDQGGLRVRAGSGRASSVGRIREGYEWGQDQGGLRVGAGSGRATRG
ncbi:RING finger and WD repeat domain-containing protein 3 [Branchiostoma belcheri]|nr:RING finger and WD repeat domain-containing protein 3 [Branchiostoma belcheri]